MIFVQSGFLSSYQFGKTETFKKQQSNRFEEKKYLDRYKHISFIKIQFKHIIIRIIILLFTKSKQTF